jgi:hypothetical protein
MMRRYLAVVAALAAMLLIGGVAWAAIPHSTTGVITGCYKNANPNKGAVIVVDAQAGEACPNGYTQLTWNKQHTHRPPVTQHSVSTGPIPANDQGTALVQCPVGKVSDGGFDIKQDSVPNAQNLTIMQAGDFIPLSTDAGPDGYFVNGVTGANGSNGVTATVTCVPNPDK